MMLLCVCVKDSVQALKSVYGSTVVDDAGRRSRELEEDFVSCEAPCCPSYVAADCFVCANGVMYVSLLRVSLIYCQLIYNIYCVVFVTVRD